MNSPTIPAEIDHLQRYDSVNFVLPTRYIERRRTAALENLVPLNPSVWNEAELNDAILALCNEIPAARMIACWHAREYCRQSTPRGTLESLLSAMRANLRQEIESNRSPFATAA